MSNANLLARFIATFPKWNDMIAVEEPVPPELDTGLESSESSCHLWKPAQIETPPSALKSFYTRIPHQLPPLYEELILSYRWLEVHLGNTLRLFPHPPTPDLETLADEILRDSAMTDTLFPLGLVPFGLAMNYDHICFDTNRRHQNGDCPIIRVEHESILCFMKLGDTWPVASSFHNLVRDLISQAESSEHFSD